MTEHPRIVILPADDDIPEASRGDLADTGETADPGRSILRLNLKDHEKEIFIRAAGTVLHEEIVVWTSKEEAVTFLDHFQSFLDQWSSDFQRNKHLDVEDAEGTLVRRGTRLIVKISKHIGALPSSLFVHDVILGAQCAGGGFADVYMGEYLGQSVAVKKIRIFRYNYQWPEFFSNITDESLLWRQLKHPNILPLLGINNEIFDNVVCMISPWMPHGDVRNFLKTDPPKTPDTLERLSGEIAEGLAYLHNISIIHGDLRGVNVLVDNEKHARLADFGLSRVISHTTTLGPNQTHGNWRWMAPEQHDMCPTLEAYIWAYACVLLEIYSGRSPYCYIPRDPSVVLEHEAGRPPSRPLPQDCIHGDIPDSAWSLMIHCFSIDRTRRPTSNQLRSLLTTAPSAIPTPRQQLAIPSGRLSTAPTASLSDILPQRAVSPALSLNAVPHEAVRSYGRTLWARAVATVCAALRFKTYRRLPGESSIQAPTRSFRHAGHIRHASAIDGDGLWLDDAAAFAGVLHRPI